MLGPYISAGGICVVTSATIVRNQYELSKGKGVYWHSTLQIISGITIIPVSCLIFINIHAFELTGYRDEINSLRKQANRLGEQTELLAQAVDELEAEASLMQNLEEQLSEIAHEQGVTVNEILLLVRENEHVLSQQTANLKVSKIFQIIFSFTWIITRPLLTAIVCHWHRTNRDLFGIRPTRFEGRPEAPPTTDASTTNPTQCPWHAARHSKVFWHDPTIQWCG